VTNVGVRPTVDSSGVPTIETHVFDVDQDFSVRHRGRVGFVQRFVTKGR